MLKRLLAQFTAYTGAGILAAVAHYGLLGVLVEAFAVRASLVDRVIERCGTVVTEAQGALDSLGPPDTESIDSLQEQSQAKVQQLVEMHAKITELTESYQVADANFVRAQQTEREWAAACHAPFWYAAAPCSTAAPAAGATSARAAIQSTPAPAQIIARR